MKMYEKLGIDPTTEEGALKITELHCSDIPDGLYEPCQPCPPGDCIKCKMHRLFSDVNTKKIKRYERIRGTFDLFNLANLYVEEKEDNNEADSIHIGSIFGFANFLSEEIEVMEAIDNENV